MPHGSEQSFGLRFFKNGREIRLVQIAGAGRIRLAEIYGDERKFWWCAPPSVGWEVVEADWGQTYQSTSEAERVATNLKRK